MDRDAAAGPTPVLEYGINKRLYLSQFQVGSREVLREEAGSAFGAIGG